MVGFPNRDGFGYAFITYEDQPSADDAELALDGCEIMGKKWSVSKAKIKYNRWQPVWNMFVEEMQKATESEGKAVDYDRAALAIAESMKYWVKRQKR